MELRDYLKMIRSGWRTVVSLLLLSLVLASAYVAFIPRTYETATTLYVSASTPATTDDLERGSNFSSKVVGTYATIIDSPAVLEPASKLLNPSESSDDLGRVVSATAPTDSTLIRVAASAGDPTRAADIVNAVARAATETVPRLEAGADGRPLVRLQQTSIATPPSVAVSPNVRQTLLLSLVVGLAAGIAATIVLQTLDDRIRTSENVRSITESPLLSEIPLSSRKESLGLVARDEPLSQAADAIRRLRANLGFLDAWQRRSIAISGINDPSAASDVVPNLGWSLAQSGRSVIILDADFRHGSLSASMGFRDRLGLSDIVTGTCTLARVLEGAQRNPMSFLPVGQSYESAPDLLGTPRMGDLIRNLEEQFDFVIVCTPPVLESADAAILSSLTGGTIFTIRSGRSKQQDLKAALTTLEIVRVKPIGLVLLSSSAKRENGRLVTKSSMESEVDSTDHRHAAPNPQRSYSLDSPTLRQRPSAPTPHPRTNGHSESPVRSQEESGPRIR